MPLPVAAGPHRLSSAASGGNFGSLLDDALRHQRQQVQPQAVAAKIALASAGAIATMGVLAAAGREEIPPAEEYPFERGEDPGYPAE